MNKFIITLLVVLPLSLSAQNFFGKDVNLYLNATVKPVEKSQLFQSGGYANFYVKYDSITKTLTKERIGKKKTDFKPFQTGEGFSAKSDYAQMFGMEFKVTAIYEPLAKFESSKGKYFVLELKNETLGTIYYEYDSHYKSSMELDIVGDISYPEGYWCNKFTVKEDKFESRKSSYSPKCDGLSISEITEEGIVSYYLRVEQGGSTLNVDGTGLFLLFSDGTKWTKPNEKIDVGVGDNGNYIYSAFVSLTLEDLKIFSSKIITDNRLYIYDGTISTEAAKEFQEYVKCLITK